jgi:hypothetical protein
MCFRENVDAQEQQTIRQGDDKRKYVWCCKDSRYFAGFRTSFNLYFRLEGWLWSLKNW